MTPLERASKFCAQAKWNPDAIPELAGLLARVISFEREECAKIAETYESHDTNGFVWHEYVCDEVAAAIRGRKP